MRTFAGILLALFSVSAPTAAQTVVLDPGHGGRDSGAVGCGLEEQDVVLDVSLRAATLLRNAGLTVHLTRSDDRFIELSSRSSFANSRGASRFVSVHANANSGTPASGTETFVYTSASSTSRSMGQGIQNELIATWGLRDRGLKSANFSVIRRTSMPGALAELAFINRCDPDAALLGSAGERARIAAALARSVLASLGRTGPVDRPAPEDPPVEPPSSGTGRLVGVTFEDVGVGLEDTTRRITGATVRVNGETLLSSTNGSFAFNFAPGTYRIEVSKDGFASRGRDCVVRAGADAWCSVGLSTARAGTTRVRGVIYEQNGSSITSAPRVAGAIVAFGGGMNVTSDSAGNFSFDVPAGSLTLDVSKAGFAPAIRSCTVSGAETWCSVGLVPSASAGAMQGVVFVAGQLSNRIETATVRIREIGTNVRSANRSGYWRFEVPAGTYTIDIEAPGYESTSESCTVREGGETWCSVGLVSDGSGASFVIDEREPEEAALDHNPTAISAGCSASGNGGSNLWLLGLLGMMLFRRRSAALTALLAISVGSLAACSESPDVAASSQALTEEAPPEDGDLMLASQVPSFARLENVTEIAQGDFIDLELSPDATHLALSHARYAALSLFSLETREVRVLREAPQAGYEPRWRDDSQVLGVRTEGQTSTAAPMLAFGVDGSEAAPFQPANTLSVRIVDDAVVMRTQDGDESRLGPPGDRYFEPRASADGEFVTFRGLSTGLYMHRRRDGATFMVGTGSHARFDAGSRFMVFERSTSDGHERISSTLFVMDLTSDELRYGPIETDIVRPDAPSIGNGRLAFMDEGSAMMGELQIQN
ncbi:MAG: N-acetylmuramoyl-L-alanine amidase [Polyangiales bacterium]|jgi:N-acetylmuramoyl-L-alanine amidase